MSDNKEQPSGKGDPATQIAEFWRSVVESSSRINETWSKSMLPFMVARAAEKPSTFGLGDGNEMSEAIERMAQGPRLADVWDFDRKMLSTFTAWSEMRQRLAVYSAVASKPWMRSLERYSEVVKDSKHTELSQKSWRDAFAVWSQIANEELISNQRTDDFLQAQKELLRAGLDFRNRQQELAETMAEIFGFPTRKEFDDVTRQITEMRRELRALSRRAGETKVKQEAPAAAARPPSPAPQEPVPSAPELSQKAGSQA
jgi:polyhydroxyalkanoate synthase subunit PhaE